MKAVGFAVGLLLMVASAHRTDLAFANGLDLSKYEDIRFGVAAYAAQNGREFDRYRFDEEAACKAIAFFPEYCCLTKAEYAGRPFVLEAWQAFDIIAPVFGWRCEDGTRRYRRGHIWVPRKNGKTELMAGTALAHLLGDGEYGAEGYALATKEEQARIVFDAARRMAILREKLGRHLQVFKDSLYCEEIFGVFRPIGGKAEGTHGKGASFRIADELHEFRDDRLLQFIDQGMGARSQPMSWDISTAGLQQGYGWELWNTCRNLADGVLVDHRTLVAIYAADDDDDPFAPETWAKANPNLGVSLKLDYMHDEAGKAKRSARHLNDFLRYHLNRWIGQLRRWLTMERWQECGAGDAADAWKTALEGLRGRKCFGGVDLASTRDFCALVWVFPPAGSDDKWRVVARLWLPGSNLEDRIRDERVPYDNWAAEGALILTDGDAADHEAIKRQIVEDLEILDVQGIGFDPWNAHKLMIELNEIRADLAIKVPQNMGAMSGPSKLLERLLLTRKLGHYNQPVLRWMASNVATISDSNGNIKPAKDKSTQKIDGIVALIIALALTQGEELSDGLPNMELLTL